MYIFENIKNWLEQTSRFDPSIGSVARSPNHNKLFSSHLETPFRSQIPEEFWRQFPTKSYDLKSAVKPWHFWLKFKVIRASTTENWQVWPLLEGVSFDNSAPKISQIWSKMPFYSKALGVDMQGWRLKRLTDLKSAWKTASHKYQPA